MVISAVREARTAHREQVAAVGVQLVRVRSLLHVHESHERRLRQCVRHHRAREDLLHHRYAHWWYVIKHTRIHG